MVTKKTSARKPSVTSVTSRRTKKSSTRANTKAAARNPFAHHAKRLYHLTPKFVHGMVAGAFIGIVVVLSLHATLPVSALSISSVRDKDSNAVIYGGALSTSELKEKYHNKGVASIYEYFGISAREISAMGSTAEAGLVWKNGNVSVDGKVVATDAITAGRENISGSTKVTHEGVTFYKRPPRVSFNPETITAFVVMKDGVFQFAILGACGNPVVATAIPKEKPKPVAPKPPATTTPTVSTQTPPSTPVTVVTTSSSPQPQQPLPNTGPGAVIIIAILSVVGGYVFHMTHRHVRAKRRGTHA